MYKIMKISAKREKRKRRHARVRAIVSGTAKIPRLTVFRSNKHIYAQIINDEKGETLISSSDLELPKTAKGKRKTDAAFAVGEVIAQKAKQKKIVKVKFDRGGYKYHGRVKALAQGARKGGLKF